MLWTDRSHVDVCLHLTTNHHYRIVSSHASDNFSHRLLVLSHNATAPALSLSTSNPHSPVSMRHPPLQASHGAELLCTGGGVLVNAMMSVPKWHFSLCGLDDITVASTGIERDEEIPGAEGEGGGQGEGEEKENAREKREEKWEGRTQGTVIGSGDCSNISPSLCLPAHAQQVLVAEEAVTR